MKPAMLKYARAASEPTPSIGEAVMRVMYAMGLALLTLGACAFAPGLPAQQAGWQPSPGHTQLAIWPGVPPHAGAVDGPEVFGTAVDDAGKPSLVSGKPWISVAKVSRPT